VARTALILAAVTVLCLAEASAQAPGQSGPAASPPSAPEPSKPADTTPSGTAASPSGPSESDSQSVTLDALMREGFEVRTTTFIPADAVTRQSGKVSSDAIVMTLQKTAVTAVCFYTLKAYVSKKLGMISACVAHR
jgi:hypothetical protein